MSVAKHSSERSIYCRTVIQNTKRRKLIARNVVKNFIRILIRGTRMHAKLRWQLTTHLLRINSNYHSMKYCIWIATQCSVLRWHSIRAASWLNAIKSFKLSQHKIVIDNTCAFHSVANIILFTHTNKYTYHGRSDVKWSRCVKKWNQLAILQSCIGSVG